MIDTDIIDEANQLMEEGDVIGALELFGDEDPADYIHLLI